MGVRLGLGLESRIGLTRMKTDNIIECEGIVWGYVLMDFEMIY